MNETKKHEKKLSEKLKLLCNTVCKYNLFILCSQVTKIMNKSHISHMIIKWRFSNRMFFYCCCCFSWVGNSKITNKGMISSNQHVIDNCRTYIRFACIIICTRSMRKIERLRRKKNTHREIMIDLYVCVHKTMMLVCSIGKYNISLVSNHIAVVFGIYPFNVNRRDLKNAHTWGPLIWHTHGTTLVSPFMRSPLSTFLRQRFTKVKL